MLCMPVGAIDLGPFDAATRVELCGRPAGTRVLVVGEVVFEPQPATAAAAMAEASQRVVVSSEGANDNERAGGLLFTPL